MYGLDNATSSYEAELVGEMLDDITNASVGNPLKDLHVMWKQANRTVFVQSCRLSVFFQTGIVVLVCQRSKTFFLQLQGFRLTEVIFSTSLVWR